MIIGNFMLLCEFDPDGYIDGLWKCLLIHMTGSWFLTYME